MGEVSNLVDDELNEVKRWKVEAANGFIGVECEELRAGRLAWWSWGNEVARLHPVEELLRTLGVGGVPLQGGGHEIEREFGVCEEDSIDIARFRAVVGEYGAVGSLVDEG